MQSHTKEHHDLMISFERTFKGYQMEREAKDMWARGAVYCHGVTNELFKAYRLGYTEHKAISRLEEA